MEVGEEAGNDRSKADPRLTQGRPKADPRQTSKDVSEGRNTKDTEMSQQMSCDQQESSHPTAPDAGSLVTQTHVLVRNRTCYGAGLCL